tara:strand:- start:7998 stop:8156 length:159 start_codon:yes stop_codon:yes gene_type:complete
MKKVELTFDEQVLVSESQESPITVEFDNGEIVSNTGGGSKPTLSFHVEVTDE